MDEDKIYSVEEANALLPYLAPALVELRERFEEAASVRLSVARAATGNGWSEKRERWATTLARVDELIEKLTEWSIQLREVSTGLIDFPGVVDGQEVWLCWRLGEPEVAYWHPKDEGFGSRRPL
ncbi:MAG TPA: DUF2203 domain-containing protein [Actinomycetota bacterium]|nr:DUF2203 domain-containing protein [Actinomycetota bacterium]